jgi:hypothetical protein
MAHAPGRVYGPPNRIYNLTWCAAGYLCKLYRISPLCSYCSVATSVSTRVWTTDTNNSLTQRNTNSQHTTDDTFFPQARGTHNDASTHNVTVTLQPHQNSELENTADRQPHGRALQSHVSSSTPSTPRVDPPPVPPLPANQLTSQLVKQARCAEPHPRHTSRHTRHTHNAQDGL